jgi:hypothetical protein
MTVLFLAWQDPVGRNWVSVGCLSFNNDINLYQFAYTKGAESPNFMPFANIENLEAVYESDRLFTLFENRLLSESRPEYKDYLRWLNIGAGKRDPMLMLAATGGARGADSLELFPCPMPTTDGNYEVQFFVRGMRYLRECIIDRVNDLRPGKNMLYLIPDIQNERDPLAIALRTPDPPEIIGYCPRYFAEDFHNLVKEWGVNDVGVSIENVNKNAPIQLRLLCKLTAPWPATFEPCAGDEYKLLTREAELILGAT